MKTVEGETSSGRTTVLKERIAGTLATLALLKGQLEGLEGAGSIVDSLQKIRAKAIKADPTLIWQRPRLPEHQIAPKSTTVFDVETLESFEIQNQVRHDSNGVSPAEVKTPILPEDENLAQEGKLLEEPEPEELAKDDLLYDSPEEVTMLENEMETEKQQVDMEDIDTERMEDLSALKLYLRDMGQFPMQRERHERWGEEIFAGELGLKVLSQLSGLQGLLSPYQKEKALRTLGKKQAKFLLEGLSLKIESIKERIEKDKYENEQNKDFDKEFIKTVLANEEFVNEALESTRAIEDEEEKEAVLERFINRQINFVNQGLESWENLVNANLRLVVSVAKKYQWSQIPLPDLINYGNEGLMAAASRYESTRGYQFSTYAHYWIKQKITRATMDYGSMIRLPVQVHGDINRGKKAQERDLQDGIQSDLPEELQKFVRLKTVFSLDEPLKDHGEDTLKDLIPDNPEQDVQEIAEESSLRDAIEEVLSTLDYRISRVLQLRFGLIDGRARTLEEIAQEMGVTRERIRQIEVLALRKLRHPSRSRKLRSFLKE